VRGRGKDTNRQRERKRKREREILLWDDVNCRQILGLFNYELINGC
jgi:hypothetical protein